MKVFYSSLVAAMLLASAGGAWAQADSQMDSGKVGSANTEENSTKVEGGTASGSASYGAEGEVPPEGPDESMSTQTGSANTVPGDTKVQGGTAAGSTQGMPEGDMPPSGPDEDMSTQTGSANTEPGDTEVQGGTAAQ